MLEYWQITICVVYTKIEMPTKDEILRILRKEMPVLRNEFGIERMAIYGSFARGEANEKSDLDILIQLSKPLGFKFISMAFFLEEILEREFDLTTFNCLQKSLNAGRKAQIAKEIEKALVYVE
jgi:predicted nucleotidyltransferase